MNSNDVNSILGNLEATAITRATEVKVAALLDRRSLQQTEQACVGIETCVKRYKPSRDQSFSAASNGFVVESFMQDFNLDSLSYITQACRGGLLDTGMYTAVINPRKQRREFFYINNAYPKKAIILDGRGDLAQSCQHKSSLELEVMMQMSTTGSFEYRTIT